MVKKLNRLKNIMSFVLLALSVLIISSPAQAASAPDLGAAANFVILGGTSVTNSGESIIFGDVGVSPGTSIIGFPPGTANMVIHSGDAVAARAQSDLTLAYNNISAQAPTTDLTGQNLGGMTLTPGVYRFSTTATMSGADLFLDSGNNENAVFIFQISTMLTTDGSSQVRLEGNPRTRSTNVFWQVGDSATLSSTGTFRGTILAQNAITMTNLANIDGRLLARNGAVTLNTNVVQVPQIIRLVNRAPFAVANNTDKLPMSVTVVEPAGPLAGEGVILSSNRTQDAFVDVAPVNLVTTNAAGQALFNITSILPGVAKITATTGKATVSTDVVFLAAADTALPVVTITSPVNGSTVNTSTIAVSGTATDNVGVTGLTVNGNAVTIVPGTSVSFSTTVTLVSGANTITVAASDASGNSGTATSIVTFTPTADTIAPVVTIASPVNGSTVNTSTIAMSGTATDNVGVTGLTVNGNAVTIVPGTSVSFSTTVTLVSGANTITVAASDAAGNSVTATTNVTFTPLPGADITPPVVTIASPVSGSTVNISTITVSGTATDNVSITGLTVNGNAVAITPGASVNFSTTVTLVSGANTIIVAASDAAGNSATATTIVTFTPTADTIAPVVTITSPVSGFTVNTSTIRVSGNATDNLGVTGLTINGNAVAIAITPDASVSFNTTAPFTLVSGTNTITVVASDAAGNSGTATLIVTFTPPAVLTTITVSPPAVSVFVGTSGSPVTATTLDQFGGPIAATVTWSSSNPGVGTIDPSTGVFTAVAAGTTLVNATALGITGSAVVTVIAAVVNGTIAGRVTNASSGAAIVGASVSAGGMTGTTDATGNYSISIAPGIYTVTANAAGFNTSSASLTVTAAAVVRNFGLLTADVGVFDTNGDGIIVKAEAVTAVLAFFSGTVPKATAVEVVIAFFRG